MSLIDDLFNRLRASGEKALMPFVTAGDPDLSFTARILAELDRRGCHLAEVGIPYSDPIADGPVIQSSYTRALERNTTLDQILTMLQTRTTPNQMPVITMISFAIVLRWGLERFVASAKAAGISGAIVPDLPLEESAPLAEVCRRGDFSLIQLVTPTTPRRRALQIAEASTGFVYYVSVTGITGERNELPHDLIDSVGWLRERTTLPVCIGFGISRAEHVRRLAPVADGLIVGSAIVRRIAAATDNTQDAVLTDVGDYVGELLEALKPN